MYRFTSRTVLAAAILLIMGASVAHASSSTISSTNKYAWSNFGGWVNFNPTNGGVTVTNSKLTGYAWSENDGWINFSPTNGGVVNSAGHLSGYAWDSNRGWVNFSGVTIDSNGTFHGTATGPTIGGTQYGLTFDCTHCDVQSTWHSTIAPPVVPTQTNTTVQQPGGFVPVFMGSTQTQPNPLPGKSVATTSSATSSPSQMSPQQPQSPPSVTPPPSSQTGSVASSQTPSGSSPTPSGSGGGVASSGGTYTGTTGGQSPSLNPPPGVYPPTASTTVPSGANSTPSSTSTHPPQPSSSSSVQMINTLRSGFIHIALPVIMLGVLILLFRVIL